MRRLRTHDLSPFNVSFQEFIHSIGKRWYKHPSKSVWKVDLKHKLTSVQKKKKKKLSTGSFFIMCIFFSMNLLKTLQMPGFQHGLHQNHPIIPWTFHHILWYWWYDMIRLINYTDGKRTHIKVTLNCIKSQIFSSKKYFLKYSNYFKINTSSIFLQLRHFLGLLHRTVSHNYRWKHQIHFA